MELATARDGKGEGQVKRRKEKKKRGDYTKN